MRPDLDLIYYTIILKMWSQLISSSSQTPIMAILPSDDYCLMTIVLPCPEVVIISNTHCNSFLASSTTSISPASVTCMTVRGRKEEGDELWGSLSAAAAETDSDSGREGGNGTFTLPLHVSLRKGFKTCLN